MINLNGVRMYVSATDQNGVVDADTTLRFTQQGSAVFARYSGGNVARGCLVGALVGSELTFRYAQREASGDIHGGHSRCDVLRLPDGRVRIVEYFTWSTRVGSGTNVFQESL
jgi:hypothetical protein